MNFSARSSGFVHTFLLILFLAAIGLAVYLVQNTQIFKSQASDKVIESLTNDLVAINRSLRGVSIQDINSQQKLIQQMEVKAVKRKELLIAEIKKDPQSFLKQATLVSDRDSFPEQVKRHLEEEKEVTGKLQVTHGDNFEKKESVYEYHLKDQAEKSYELFLVKNDIQLNSASSIVVKGVVLESNLVSATVDDNYRVQVIQEVEIKTTGNQKVAAILLNFQSNPQENLTINRLKEYLFDGAESVAKYYQEASYGKLTLSGEAFGYYTLTIRSGSCDDQKWMQEGDKLARNSGVNLEGYDHIIYVVSGSHNCSYGGYAFGRVTNRAPSRSIVLELDEIGVYTHELGHNLGLSHANFLNCPDKSIEFNYRMNCYHLEYGDPYDVMGYAYPHHHFNAPHKIKLNWIPTSSIKTILPGQSGVYTISDPWDKSPSGISVLKIPKEDSADDYYLEFRKQFGFDKNLPLLITQGALLHLSSPWLGAPYLIDTILSPLISLKGSLEDAALVDGLSFVDPYNGLTIKQLSHTSESVTVEVKFGPKLSIPTSTPTPVIVRKSGSTGYKLVPLNSSYRTGDEVIVELLARSDNYPANYFYAKVFYPKNLLTAKAIKYPPDKTLIEKWNQVEINDAKGYVYLAGSVEEGFQTQESSGSALMAQLVFEAKNYGIASLNFDQSASYIYVKCNNCNYPFTVQGTQIKIQDTIKIPPPKPYKGYCIQVLTYACSIQDPSQCHTWADPCSVPDGWKVQIQPQKITPTPTFLISITPMQPQNSTSCAYKCGGGGYCGTGGDQPGSFPTDCNITCPKTWVYNSAGDNSCPSSHNYCWTCPQ